jgi:putative transposase
MVRQLRLAFPGALYHITSRGNLRGDIFFENSDKARFLDILSRTKKRYGYLLHAYVFMDNHYHLIVETPQANIAQIMQNINTSYTIYVNTKYNRRGHLFQGRYTSIIVEKDSYLLELSRYIHLNPVRAHLVESPEHYLWSSCSDYCGLSRDVTVDVSDILSFFSKDRREAMKKYREFVSASKGTHMSNPFSELQAGFILGSTSYVQQIQEVLKGLKENNELPALRRVRREFSQKDIIEKVAEYYTVDKVELIRRRKACKERNIAIYVTKIMSGAKNNEVGQQFNIKGAAVSVVLKRMEKQLQSQSDLKKEVEAIKRRILDNL